MPVKFFGQFLLEKNVITKEALLKAVALQESTNLKFGEMCVKLGILTGGQLKAVLAKQKTSHLCIG